MKQVRRPLAVAALFGIVSACTGPAAPKISYAGEWTGVTAQGEAIAFTISADEVVTAITLGHAFNGCRGSQTFANLNLPIAPQVTCIPGPCSGSVSAYRAFSYQAGNSLQEPMTTVVGMLSAGVNAQGAINFREFTGCGSAIGVAWSATKH